MITSVKTITLHLKIDLCDSLMTNLTWPNYNLTWGHRYLVRILDHLAYLNHLLLYLGPETQQGAIKKDQKVSNDIMSHFEEISPWKSIYSSHILLAQTQSSRFIKAHFKCIKLLTAQEEDETFYCHEIDWLIQCSFTKAVSAQVKWFWH